MFIGVRILELKMINWIVVIVVVIGIIVRIIIAIDLTWPVSSRDSKDLEAH